MTKRRVLFISRGFDAPSTRYRARAYFPSLEQAGWEPMHETAERDWPTRLRILRRARKVDAVVVLRKTFSGLFRVLLRGAARKLILDIDDAIYVRDSGDPSPSRMRRFARMASCCDQIWCGNSHLAEQARQFKQAVTILPTSIDPGKYHPQQAQNANATGNGHVELVWIGSSATRKYLEQALPAFEAAARTCPALRLNIIADFTLHSDRLPIAATPWSEATEAAALSQADIGIAPMTDDPWTRGKCGLKVLQYMAAALPVIADAVGVHRDLILPGQTGLLVENPADWPDAIAQLAGDPAGRHRMGQAGRDRVCEHFATAVTAQRLIEQLDR